MPLKILFDVVSSGNNWKLSAIAVDRASMFSSTLSLSSTTFPLNSVGDGAPLVLPILYVCIGRECFKDAKS